jgi:DNA-binding IclR family transcriptional regulator
LELLSEHPAGLIASDIARMLGMPRNSAGRVLAALVDRGYVARNQKTKVRTLTRRLLELGSSIVCENHIIEESMDAMRALRDHTTETVLLSVNLDASGVVLEQMPARHQVRLVVDPGTSFELHCSAPGKLGLALLPEVERDAVLERLALPRRTSATITGMKRFREELDLIRKQGYSVDRGEGIAAVHCVSAPVRGRSGECVACLTVTAPEARLPMSDFSRLSGIVVENANRISRRLGYEDAE